MPIFHRDAVSKPIKGVVSASWLYPFKGIYFFVTQPAWWPLLGRKLPVLILTSVVVLGILFFWTYLPIVAFLAIFHGPTAWFNAVFIVLGAGQVVVALLFEALMVDETLVDVFDAVLLKEGLVDMVSPFRVLHHDAPNPVKMLGIPASPAVYSPFSFRQIIEFVLFLPLNLIPVIGTPFFLVITGARAGPLHHWRYFKLRGLNKKERNNEIRSRQWKYTWFGTVALLLQLIPILSMFFLLTTAAGSALWVFKLEEQKRVLQADEVVDEDLPPAYRDDPI